MQIQNVLPGLFRTVRTHATHMIRWATCSEPQEISMLWYLHHDRSTGGAMRTHDKRAAKCPPIEGWPRVNNWGAGLKNIFLVLIGTFRIDAPAESTMGNHWYWDSLLCVFPFLFSSWFFFRRTRMSICYFCWLFTVRSFTEKRFRLINVNRLLTILKNVHQVTHLKTHWH